MKPLLIQGGRIIDPRQGIDTTGDLLIVEGKVTSLGNFLPVLPEYDILPAQGRVVCPGFIDLHCHLRQPGFEHKETIATGTRAAAKGGFTTVCGMPNTEPPPDSRDNLEYIKRLAQAEGVVRVLPLACITQGREGKELAPISELAEAGAVAFSDDGNCVMDSGLMRQALEQSLRLGLPIADHCEDMALAHGGVMNESQLSIKLGLKGIPPAAEEIMVARDIRLAQLTGGWLHVTHVSTAGSVELIRQAKRNGTQVTAEVTPNHLTLTEDEIIRCGANAKVNPPLRTQKDIMALIQGLKDNVIDVVATDHAPHTLEEKQAGLALAPMGISSLETALGSLLALVHSGQLSLITVIAKLTCEPARILGDRFGKLGTLAPGSPADITIFAPDQEWVVDTSTFVSKGKNTPLEGKKLKGKIMSTIFRGELVFQDSSVKTRPATL